MHRFHVNFNTLPGPAFIIFVLLVSTSRAQDSPRFHWYRYSIDREKPVGAYTSLAIDSQGFPNIAYTRAEGRRGLKFARFDGASWQVSMVDPAGQGRLKMVLDSTDRPHIVYTSDSDSRVMYAVAGENIWQIRTVAVAAKRTQAFYDKAIQVDKKGQVHLVYGIDYELSGIILLQTTYTLLRDSVLATPIRVDSLDNNGKWNSMVLNSNDLPVAAYYTSMGNPVVAYMNADSTWRREMMENDGFRNNQGFYVSLRTDGTNHFFSSFHNQTTGTLCFASGSPGHWTFENVAKLTGWTTYTTPSPLALDQFSNPYIAFYDRHNGDLKLAYKQNSTWYVEAVDTVGNVGEHAALEINHHGMPVISFYDNTNQELRLVIGSVTAPVDSDGDGIADYLEVIGGTNYQDIDSDDDGLGDGEEDLNQNGQVDSLETDPLNPDTDGDGILDGIETGRAQGIPGAGAILGTDPAIFTGDINPATTTDPLTGDTDADGLEDGFEDKNHNGAVDFDETDPNNPDSDGDGLLDGIELKMGTNPLDLDSDDDGLSDKKEDINLNGRVDMDETAPLLFDSDGDGLGDGLECGVTMPVLDPDGAGRLLGTNLTVFIPDHDPGINSSPIHFDTDGDGVSDGAEDKNKNGAVDPGETNFSRPDTDGDGETDGDEIHFMSNPLDGKVTAGLKLLYQDHFTTNDLSAWHIIDAGDRETPSDWFVYDHALVQTSNIWGGTEVDMSPVPYKPGTFIILSKFTGDNYKVTFKIKSIDDDEIGVAFRYQDPQNYYLFSMNKEYCYRRIVKVHNGNASILASQEFSYQTNQVYQVMVYTVHSRLLVFLNGVNIFNIQDDDIASGTITFYCWKNEGASFQDLQIFGPGAMTVVNQIIQDFSGSISGQEIFLTWQISQNPNLSWIELVRNEKVKSVSIKTYDLTPENTEITLNGTFTDKIEMFTTGYQLIAYDNNRNILDKKELGVQSNPPKDFHLYDAFPNPSSTLTTCLLQAPRPVCVDYKIFDILGRVIYHFGNTRYHSGSHSLSWDGTDAGGNATSSGVYFIQVQITEPDHPNQILWQQNKKVLRLRQ